MKQSNKPPVYSPEVATFLEMVDKYTKEHRIPIVLAVADTSTSHKGAVVPLIMGACCYQTYMAMIAAIMQGAGGYLAQDDDADCDENDAQQPESALH